jgi:hypothetical protein
VAEFEASPGGRPRPLEHTPSEVQGSVHFAIPEIVRPARISSLDRIRVESGQVVRPVRQVHPGVGHDLGEYVEIMSERECDAPV